MISQVPKMKPVLLTPEQQRFVIHIRSTEPEFVRRGAVLEWAAKIGIGQKRVKMWMAEGYLPQTKLEGFKESRYERDVMLRKLLAMLQKRETLTDPVEDVASDAGDEEGSQDSNPKS